MSRITRYAKLVAHDGRGEELARVLLAAAEDLMSDPGCELYLINRQSGAPETIWVTEAWRSQADLDAVTSRIRGSERVAATMALVSAFDLIELDPLGGKGLPG